MPENKLIKLKDHESIIAHIEITQGIINRLADNSAKCKDWCFAFVGALIIFIVSGDNLAGKWMFSIAYAIVLMFCILDCYYLGLERKTRDNYEKFVKSLNQSAQIEDSEEPRQVEVEDNGDTTNLNTVEESIFLPNLEFSQPKKKISGKELSGILYGMSSPSTFIPYFSLFAMLTILTIFYEPSPTACQCCC